MSVAALVKMLRARGVTLEPRGDKLRVRPAGAVRPEEVEALRQHKATVLALLTRGTAAGVEADPASGASRSPVKPAVRWWSHPWPDELRGLGIRHVGPFDLCAECERWSWVRYGNRVLCLACATRRRRSMT